MSQNLRPTAGIEIERYTRTAGALTDARRLSAEMRKLRRAGTQGEAEDLEPTDDELREIESEQP
jgi:hypothetical protein